MGAPRPMSKERFEALSPRARGYAVYWLGENPAEPHVPNEKCPYRAGSQDAADWYEGQRVAAQDAQDSEE